MELTGFRGFSGIGKTIKKRFGPHGVRGLEAMAWRVVGLAASAVGSIWAARCLGPKNLGISGVVMSLVGMITLASTFALDSACIRTVKCCSSDGEIAEFTKAIISLRTLLACAVSAIACVAVAIAGWIGAIPSMWWLAIAIGLPLLYLLGNPPLWLLQAKEMQLTQYRLNAAQSVFMAAAYLIFFRPGAAPGSDMVVQGIAIALNFGFAWRLATGRPLGMVLSVSLQAARAGWKYARVESWATALGLVSYSYTALSLPLVGLLSSVPEAGRFRAAANLAQSVFAVLLIYMSIIYPRVLSWHREDPQKLFSRQIQATRMIAPWLIGIMACAAMAGPRLIPIILGPQYSGAEWPFVVLVGGKILVTFASIFVSGVRAHRKDQTLCICTLGVMLCSLGLNWIVVPRFGALGAAFVTMFSESLVLGTCLYLCSPLAKSNRSSVP